MIEDIDDIDELLDSSAGLSWQEFERLVSEIVAEHGYAVETNRVETSPNRRAQFDVLGSKGGSLLSIDCKHWDKNRYKTAAVMSAVEDHLKRCAYLAEKRCSEVIPMLVTLYDEDLAFHRNVPVVPLQKLNSFLLEIDMVDSIARIKPRQKKLS